MARLLDTDPALVFSRDREFAEIEAWYRAKLENTAPHFTDGFAPVTLGKAWKWDKTSGWDLPGTRSDGRFWRAVLLVEHGARRFHTNRRAWCCGFSP